MKIIFLDIDGVLNAENTKDRIGRYIGLDNSKIEILKHIIDETGAKIVLSSSWRNCRDNKVLHRIWNALVERLASYDLEIIDITPTNCEYSYRGYEIQQWFKDNQDLNIESFIILDDDNDLKPYGSRHIQTSWKNGMESKHGEMAIIKLNEECKPWFDDTPYWKQRYNSGENRQI